MKNIIYKPILISSLVIGVIASNLGGTTIGRVNPNPHITQYVNENIVIENDNEGGRSLDANPNLNLKGMNFDTRYRIFIDSTNDKSLPNNGHETYNDYLIGKGKKNSWYEHLIQGLSIDVTEYAEDKTDFLNQYRAVAFSYLYNYNFWNTWYGWSYEYGKNAPMLTDVKNYELTGNNNEWEIFNRSDSGHSNNEKARLILKQEWNGNILNYNFYLGVLYNWKAGSVVKHASFASFKSDEYTFIKPEDSKIGPIKVDGLYETKSTFALSQHEIQLNLAGLDTEIKRKAIDLENFALKRTGLLVQGYYGTLEVNNTIYIFSLVIRWLDLPNLGSTLLLNKVNLFRSMSTNYTDGNFKFHYEDSFGLEQDTNSFVLPSEYLGMEMKGNFFLPFIYG